AGRWEVVGAVRARWLTPRADGPKSGLLKMGALKRARGAQRPVFCGAAFRRPGLASGDNMVSLVLPSAGRVNPERQIQTRPPLRLADWPSASDGTVLKHLQKTLLHQRKIVEPSLSPSSFSGVLV